MTLTEFGVDKATSELKLNLMADRALEDMCYRFNPYPANHDDLIGLYKKFCNLYRVNNKTQKYIMNNTNTRGFNDFMEAFFVCPYSC